MGNLTDPAIERGILRVLAVTNDTPGRAADLIEQHGLAAEMFTDPSLAEVFRAVYSLSKRRLGVDLTSVSAETKSQDAVVKQGHVWLAELLGGIEEGRFLDAWEHQFPTYAKRLRDLTMRRALAAQAQALMAAAHAEEGDPLEAASACAGQLASLAVASPHLRTLQGHVKDAMGHLGDVMSDGAPPVMTSGIAHLDAVMGGLQPGVLTMVGALPGVGKSAMLATIAESLAVRGIRSGVFSLEDMGDWLAWRLISNASDVSQFRMRTQVLTQYQYDLVAKGIKAIWDHSANILVDDRPSLTTAQIVASARDMVLNCGARAIFVDHLGEVRLSGKYRDRHDLDIRDALADLRDLAKTHKIPVVVFAHLQRIEPGEQPQLHHFANSAAVERMARVALGLYRMPGSEDLNVAVLKQTNGRAGVVVRLKFRGRASMVADPAGPIPTELLEDGGDNHVH